MPLNVKAVSGDSRGTSAKRLVRRTSAIAANDIDLRAGMPNQSGEIGEDIVKVGIEMVYLTCPVVAQEIVELGERTRNVLFTVAINNLNPLAGVRVVK